MALDTKLASLVEPHLDKVYGLSTVGLGICWPNESTLANRLHVMLRAGETLDEAAERMELSWSPRWLVESGFTPVDQAGVRLHDGIPATVDGASTWEPLPRLCRVDDQTSDGMSERALAKRLAGEVALSALWRAAAVIWGVPLDARPVPDLTAGARGARFKDFLVFVLGRSLPHGWRVVPEVPLTSIRGLHMRKTVGKRSSDIAVIDEGNRLVAVVSSKWTWRSDRGTEAAQMVPLMRYRPDVPYTLVTAEFPRAGTVSRESVEDRAYHLCPDWVGAWKAIYATTGSPRTSWPRLEDLRTAGRVWAEAAALPGLVDLVTDLKASGTIL